MKQLRLLLLLLWACSCWGQAGLSGSAALTGQARLGAATGGPTTFVQDSFTDTDGTALTSHTGETGATWTLHPAFAGRTVPNIYSNEAVGQDANRVVMLASGTSTSADYTVQVDVAYHTVIGNETEGLVARYDATNDSGYWLFVYWDSNAYLSRCDNAGGNGCSTNLTSCSITRAASHTLKLVLSGSTLRAYVNGSQCGTDVTDSTYSSAGRTGIVIREVSTSSTGFHLDNFVATTP